MNKFEIVNLEGLGIKAEVIDDGAVYLAYEGFANAAGHPDAVANSSFSLNEKFDRSDELNEEIVDVLARGKHENGTELIYVIKAKSGEKFLIGERGLKITKRFVDFHDMEYGDLIKHVEESIRALRLRAYKEGYEQGRFDEKIEGSGSEQYQQQRDEIVERAKRDVAKIIGKYDSFNITIGRFNNQAVTAKFVVNAEKRTVVALIYGYYSKDLYYRGIAKCAPNDCFNVHIGKAIALRRALGLEVPSEYLNAPQPTEVRVGDFIFAMGKVRKVVSSDDEVCVYTNPPTCNIKSKMTTSLLERIIDDSREEV